jgi:hypothetical protein
VMVLFLNTNRLAEVTRKFGDEEEERSVFNRALEMLPTSASIWERYECIFFRLLGV